MEAIRLETIIESDGQIAVPGVHVGDDVEVIVLIKSPRTKAYPLRGTGGYFLDPCEPVIPESDWGA